MGCHSKAPPRRLSSNRCKPLIERIAGQMTGILHNPAKGETQMNSKENDSSTQSSRKTAPEEYDLVILGSGAGSKLSAWTFAGHGQHVAVIQRKYICR